MIRLGALAWERHRAAASLSRRYPIVIAMHAVLAALSAYLACWLRFDGNVPAHVMATFAGTLPWVLVIRGVIFLPFGLYGGLWRYTGIWDLSRIVLAVAASSVAIFVVLYQPRGAAAYPRSIVVIDSLLLVSFVGGARLVRRILNAAPRSSQGQRVLIVGAGDAGEMIVREMRRAGGYWPVGFIDDNPLKVGRTIHGVTVLGTRNELPRIIETTKPQEVLIAIPSAKAAAVRNLVQRLEAYKLPITTLPDLKELVNGKVGVKQIRPLAIEDLLPRSPVALNIEAVRLLVQGKRVLVTGAGGSIGSELCRQLATLGPAALLLFERYENSLYAVANDLAVHASRISIRPTVGDVTDARRVDAIFSEHRPDLVFHAAAHKHVPLMEANPCEAVKNNVAGTRTVAEAARRHGSECFVLISTDKAANPSSVMGATKRVAELIVQAVGRQGTTRFVTVRFGNVLGSNGSVIPRMVEQIRAGGPVTVTDPEIRRYFMLIPEAVELVLQAAVLARHRETFVLDMGEQFKILDMAKNLIRLSGFVPDEEIPIAFVGLRPGEKLVEELVGRGEVLEPSEIKKVSRVRGSGTADAQRVGEQVEALIRAAVQGDVEDTIAQLIRIVPTFTRLAPAPAGVGDAAVVRAARPRATRPPVLTPVPPPPAPPGRLAALKPQA